MSYPAEWHARNADFLAEALTWLRNRLEQVRTPSIVIPGTTQESTKDTVESTAKAPPKVKRKRVPSEETAAPANDHLPAPKMEPPPALMELGRRLQLSLFELDVLWLCIAVELDARIPALCAKAQDDESRPYPTFALALQIFDEPSWDVLSPERPLRYWRLIEIVQGSLQPLITSCLRIDERIVHLVKGLEYVDDRIASLFAPFESAEDVSRIPPSQAVVAEAIVREWKRTPSPDPGPLIQLVSADAKSAQLIARKAAADVGSALFRIPASLLPGNAAEIDTAARLWNRETLLQPVALYLDAQELDSSGAQSSIAQRFFSRARGALVLGAAAAWSYTGKETLTFDVERPLRHEQLAAWKHALGRNAGAIAGELASQFHFSTDVIRNITAAAAADPKAEGKVLRKAIWSAATARARPRLDSLAQRLNAKATWHDIVLPAEPLDQLQKIAHQVAGRSTVYDEWGFGNRMNRGLGITALFAGDSGTGKTMAAEVIANELELSLYRIDLSAVVSKYIGETEKNLRKLFDVAEDGGAILFFDEADALFGKRSEVKDSHDRYANIEINYLLQRMESYRGLAILATNMRSALDLAFTRRLRFIVNFTFPAAAERKRIWERVFPPETPTVQLDHNRLARLNLTGGNIQSAALHAAFLAAHQGGAVTMPLVFAAVRAELQKLDKPVNEAELRWLEPAGVVA
jgi:hypothetical protein